MAQKDTDDWYNRPAGADKQEFNRVAQGQEIENSNAEQQQGQQSRFAPSSAPEPRPTWAPEVDRGVYNEELAAEQQRAEDAQRQAHLEAQQQAEREEQLRQYEQQFAQAREAEQQQRDLEQQQQELHDQQQVAHEQAVEDYDSQQETREQEEQRLVEQFAQARGQEYEQDIE